METNRGVFCIVDASSFIFRAYYAIRHLSNKKGLPTNATYGFVNMIVKVLEDLSPSHVAIVYDTKHPSFRKKKYPLYKANRSEMPDDLIPQVPYIKKFIQYLGLPHFEKKGFEADDLIAALAHFGRTKSQSIFIISSDKDLMQLVDKSTLLFDTMKDKKIGPQEVEEKMGVLPQQITDYLGLVGDTSDNIPGVKGIGPKSAATLLQKYGSMENLYKNLNKLPPNKQHANLKDHKASAFLSKELATVAVDVGMDFYWDKLACSPTYNNELKALLEELEFKKIGSRLAKLSGQREEEKLSPSTTPTIPQSYHCIDSIEKLKKIFQKLEKHKEIAIDTETTGISHDAELVGFSFCTDEKEAWYVPLAHKGSVKQCALKPALDLLKKSLKRKKLIGQNVKFDINILQKYGLEIKEEDIGFDTMVASYILEPSSRHGMNELSKHYLGHSPIEYKDICGTGKSEITFAEVDVEQATKYAAEDAQVTWLLYKKLLPLIKEKKNLEKVFYEIELPLIPVLASMEQEGIAINQPYLSKLSKSFKKNLDQLEESAYSLAGETFNLASPKQLQEILFTKLGLPTIKKTKTGFSTDVEVLSKLSIQHELPAVILEFREIAKLKNTYVDVLPQLTDKNERVHTSFNQTVTATGRLSSSDPNMQNIPIRTEIGKKIRKAFVAKEKHVLMGADYSQIELRILALLSKDPSLRKALQRGGDIHKSTAAQIFHVDLEKVTEDQRRKAKAVNFGILYGKTAFSLAEELKILRSEAVEIIDNYFFQYPTIKNFLAELIQSASKKGYAETLFGRKRVIPEINAKNKIVRSMAERMAINTPIQGTAADLIKIAMIKLSRTLTEKKYKARLILQVHDELVLELPSSEVEEVSKIVKNCMEDGRNFPLLVKNSVPIIVEIHTGKNWLELK